MKNAPIDTIIAPATPIGEGGIGILRLSGPKAEDTLLKYFSPSRPPGTLQSHRLYHGVIRSSQGEVFDEVMAVVMRRPHSYTREDVAEVHCHGGALTQRRILDLFIEEGVRLARPGEFTLRAFLNGRLDLTQAEAVIDLIRARSEMAHRVAVGQLKGRLSAAIYRQREAVADLLAHVESHIDFPEEEIERSTLDLLRREGDRICTEITTLLESFDSGRVLREGISVLILGRPNAGKSSLLNSLLGEARAIVNETPGTTRDLIEESLTLGGLPLRLIDTAGVRDTSDPIEAEGVRRARDRIETADLVLLVVDGSQPFGDADHLALSLCRERRVLIVYNKADLGSPSPSGIFTDYPSVTISVHTGAGLEDLRERIVAFFLDGYGEGEETVLLNDRRHKEALLRSRESLSRFIQNLEESSAEISALELRECLDALGEITGETTPDDILGRIFSRFCIGK